MNYIACNQYRPFEPIESDGPNHVTLAKLLSGYRELVADLGGNPESLLNGVGLTGGDLEDPFALIPVRAIGQLLEDSAALLGCPDFGMRIAERQTLEGIMQPLDRLCRTAPSVRDALQCCSQHMAAYNSGLVMDVDAQGLGDDDFDTDELCSVEHRGLHMVDFKLLNGLSLFPQFMEQLLLMTHKCIVELSAGFAKSRMIWFSHLAISPPVAYARRFNSVIRFGQEYDAILFSDNDLETTIAGSNQDLFAAEAHLASRLFPVREKEIDAQVRQAVFQALTRSEECNRQFIARRLGFQERTLNRHLHKKGTSFEAIRDEVRRNLAYRYLARADLTLSDIAGRLGYSELAVLSRCCQRWFGSSPRQVRQSLVAARLNADTGGKLRPAKSARSQHDRLPEMKTRWPSGAAFRARQPISML